MSNETPRAPESQPAAAIPDTATAAAATPAASPPAAASRAHEDQPVGLTVHALPSAVLPDERRTRVGRWKLLLVLLVCASPVIASYLTYFVIRPEGRTNYATLIDPSRTMPAWVLKTLDGQPLEMNALRRQWLLVVVGPSTCDAACEALLFMQRQLREMTGRERERIDKLWLVTDEGPVDAKLQQALQSTPAMHIARADRAAVAAWLEPAAGSTLESHLYIVDPMGQWMMRAPAQPDPAKLKKDIDRLLRASAFWDHETRGGR